MNRLIWLVCGIFILMSPRTLLAQRRGGQGAARPPTGVPGTDDPTGFKRAVALQATPDQVMQFRQLTNSTQVARKHAQALLQLAEDANKPNLLHSTNPLTSAVEDAQTNTEQFLRSFSAAQKSGLVNVTKKLGKANSEVTKQNNSLTLGLGHSGIDGKQIAGVVERLDKALRDLETKQVAVGTEMGIQSSGSVQ